MTRTFTDAEKIQRVWDVYQIKNLMGRHAYCHAYDLHAKEIDELWVKKPENQATASFGQNWGYQVGLDLIRDNYATKNIKNRMKDLKALCEKYPDIEYKPENHGLGSMLIHSLTTPYVEVAGDGKTAQGMWYAPGQVTVAHPDSVDALYMYEKYATDFIKEDGEWKIWHLFVGTDFMLPAGADMTKEPVDPPEFDLNDGDPETDLVVNYRFEAYTSRYNCPEYPPVPKPYETFADTVSYGLEGNPNYQGGLRK